MRKILALACLLVLTGCSRPVERLTADTPSPSPGASAPASRAPVPAQPGRARSAVVTAPSVAPEQPRSPTPVPTPVPLPSGVILGTVTDAEGRMLADVCVSALHPSSGEPAFGTTSDARGVFRLIGDPGRYLVRVDPSCVDGLAGLLSAALHAIGGEPAVVDVRAAGVRGVDVTLPAKGRLTGIARHAGLPLAGVCVQAASIPAAATETAVTDVLGAYTVVMDAGTFSVRYAPCEPPASALGLDPVVREPVDVRPGGTTRIDVALL